MKSLSVFIILLLSKAALASKGEVKILYPCESLATIPHEKEVAGIVTFLETKEGTFYKNGLILRQRQNDKETDTTIKMRWDNYNPSLDPEIEGNLARSSNGELKCETDLNYGSDFAKEVTSCSFKSEGLAFLPEHTEFLKMVKSPLREIPEGLITISVSSSNWKVPIMVAKKKPELERWINDKGECILEASVKFDRLSSSETLELLKKAIPAAPSRVQTSKTAWALGL